MEIDVAVLVTQINGSNAKIVLLGMAALGVIITVFTLKVLRRAV
ncbi:major capsid protein [Chromobacterium haemolyticum]|nr:major capsid protein [Chromobacterium haemolyticum]MDH0340245.1 major capsid protein [Chromobacterium haemolyticum]